MLPLFYEKTDSPAMLKHGTNLVKQITQYLNPVQTPVLPCDCPNFAQAKYLQWQWPNEYGEEKVIDMFGGLNVEKALWSTLRDVLNLSGWTNALSDANIAKSYTNTQSPRDCSSCFIVTAKRSI